eukprot:2601017-Prymnesium_polylepis.1
MPVKLFLERLLTRSNPILFVTSVGEDRLLREMGTSHTDRNQIEGLQSSSADLMQCTFGLTNEQLSSRALMRIAADPPPDVGSLQRRTADWILRP